MPTDIHLLRPDGSTASRSVIAALQHAVAFPGDTDPDTVLDEFPNGKTVHVVFAQSSDGRGLSLPSVMRRAIDFTGEIIATGALNPDQVSLAFQCGFDGLLIEDKHWQQYGEDAWLNALKPVINRSYRESRWRSMPSIWALRHT